MGAHKDLSGIDLHEPKGVEDASSGQYYAADGAGSGAWTSLPAGIVIPAGIMVDYAGSSAPSLWLLCYGQAVSRTTYSSLFSAISTAFGTGDGSTTFNLPDCRGRVAVGKDDMGGSAASRVTTAGSSVDGLTLGATGGAQNVTIALANLPAANLSISSLTGSVGTTISNGTSVTRSFTEDRDNQFESGTNQNGVVDVTFSSSTISLASGTVTFGGSVPLGGSGTATNVMQPSIVLNKIIYAGV